MKKPLYLFNAKKGTLPWEAVPKEIRDMLTESFKISPEYAIHKIFHWDDTNRLVFHFGTMGSFSICDEQAKLILKYDMSIQVPGNQEYLWSLSLKSGIVHLVTEDGVEITDERTEVFGVNIAGTLIAPKQVISITPEQKENVKWYSTIGARQRAYGKSPHE